MKADIHPNYVVTEVRCSCGNTFTTRSTKGDMHVELCSECHPFYTGKQKLVDSGGRIDRFERVVKVLPQEVVVTAVDPRREPERASALFDVRLGALVARHFGVED